MMLDDDDVDVDVDDDDGDDGDDDGDSGGDGWSSGQARMDLRCQSDYWFPGDKRPIHSISQT